MLVIQIVYTTILVYLRSVVVTTDDQIGYYDINETTNFVNRNAWNIIFDIIILVKETVAERWDSINVVSAEWNIPSTGLETGQEYTLRYVIDEQGLDDAVGLEKVNVFVNKEGEERIYSIEPLKMVGREGNNFIFEAKLAPLLGGGSRCAPRVCPSTKNNLPPPGVSCYLRGLELPQM